MIRAIVVDDEIPSLRKLEKQLADSGLVDVAAVFTEPEKALEYLSRTETDAVFLDIEMPGMDGIEAATRILDIRPGISIVFETAYNQYAVEAFRLNALDYLLKPVSADRLMNTLNRLGNERKAIQLSSEKLNVRCFGKFNVSVGVSEVKFRTEKAGELLAFLIGCRGAFVSRSKITDSLWEDFEGDRALIHFNTTLHNVKKALQAHGIQIPVLYEQGCYMLDINVINSDYLKFCAACEKRRMISRDNITEYEEAVSCYSGEYLAGWDHQWIAGKRILLEEQYLSLLLDIAVFYINSGDGKKAADRLRAGLICEPLHRELNLRLIQALMAAREPALASKYYEMYRAGLKIKLNKEPDEAFTKLLK